MGEFLPALRPYYQLYIVETSMGRQAGAAGDGCAFFILLYNGIIPTSLCSFIIDGVITLPIALYGFLVFPDLPTTTRAFYLSEEVST